MTKTPTVAALVGGQFGSEGKGLIAAHVAQAYDVHIRTGAANAGHTYYVRDSNGELQKVVARGVPVGAVNKEAWLIIGPGALVDIDVLCAEIAELDALGLNVSERLTVDSNAMVLDPVQHHAYEGGVDGEAHRLIGSTGEGVGPARMARVARGTMSAYSWSKIKRVGEVAEGRFRTGDTAALVNGWIDRGFWTMLEGTQGSGLSLVHGPWPYVTSTDTNAAQLAADAGIAPRLVGRTILVCRTFPIRVAGNSGPLPGEISWDGIGQPEERTTVTKKVRRVGRWSTPLVRRAVMLNRPTEIALTFFDYVAPHLAGCRDPYAFAPGDVQRIHALEQATGVEISMVGTGPYHVVEAPDSWRRAHQDIQSSWPTMHEAYFRNLVEVPA